MDAKSTVERYLRWRADAKKQYTEEEMRLAIAGAIATEREACARICEEERDNRLRAGMLHPEDSPSRSRCFAAARAALHCLTAIRARNSLS